MKIPFCKYHGTGNDFILIDNFHRQMPALSRAQVAALCHRRFGIGADGLMLLEAAPDADFRMVYYNSDGGESTMCGNGGRCITAFAKRLGIIESSAKFRAIDGLHLANINSDETVSLHMQDVSGIVHEAGYSILDTGSPHFIKWVGDAAAAEVLAEGRRLRNAARFAPGGTNVNFVQRIGGDRLFVRTYERGVEDETLSCGTGVTAAAIAAAGTATGRFNMDIETPGGFLNVRFVKNAWDTAHDVVLSGPASFVFKGDVRIPS